MYVTNQIEVRIVEILVDLLCLWVLKSRFDLW